MTDAKFTFCSEDWVAVADDFLKRSAAGANADLSGIDYTFNEVFTNAPAELGTDAEGRAGWYMRAADGAIEARRGILEDPDVLIQLDYAAILPLARTVFENNAAGQAEAATTMQRLTEAGRLTRVSKLDSPPEMPWSTGLHDVLAKRTL
jgi:hypothetical protein